ncbi:MAG TPA: anaerobic sulfite reductase subunit AsrA [Victivallales bacterium]|nr:anaerobic sulfite reductase subunit AsrA [Victivallales bacterium]
MSYKFNLETFNNLIGEISKNYDIYAPMRCVGSGRFSDTDLIRYGQIKNASDIVPDVKSNFSPKEIIFPINETLFYFTEDDYREPKSSTRKILIFLRACDIQGFERLDQIFLNNSDNEDFYYKRIRERVSFALLECRESFDNCFCASMGCNTADDYSFALRFTDKNVLLEMKDSNFDKYFDGYSNDCNFKPEQIATNSETLNVPDLAETDINVLYDEKFWEEYKSRCIGCGRCNTTCITCNCHSTCDIFYDDNCNVGERTRTWSSCQVDGFTDMAGGMSFRKDYGARMRYKVLHKILDFKKRFGTHMCVGCGRCDDNCPEYISYLNCLKKLDKLQEK